MNNTYRSFLDLFFPHYCVYCRRIGAPLCETCHQKIQSIAPKIILRPTRHLSWVIASAQYQNPLIQAAVKGLKFDNVKEVAQPLGDVLASALKTFHRDTNYTLVPVPLHRKRLLRRGFNQSELIALHVARQTNLAIETQLYRKRKTATQSKLSKEERLENMRNAFCYQGAGAPREIILVDDVATTFSTLENAAQELKFHGAKRVGALVVAYET